MGLMVGEATRGFPAYVDCSPRAMRRRGGSAADTRVAATPKARMASPHCGQRLLARALLGCRSRPDVQRVLLRVVAREPPALGLPLGQTCAQAHGSQAADRRRHALEAAEGLQGRVYCVECMVFRATFSMARKTAKSTAL